jgi:hypothetical protein
VRVERVRLTTLDCIQAWSQRTGDSREQLPYIYQSHPVRVIGCCLDNAMKLSTATTA